MRRAAVAAETGPLDDSNGRKPSCGVPPKANFLWESQFGKLYRGFMGLTSFRLGSRQTLTKVRNMVKSLILQ